MRKVLVAAAVTAAGVGFSSAPAGAAAGCTLNVHPVDGLSRQLQAVRNDGSTVVLLTKQGKNFPLPGGVASFTVPADTVEVRWVLLQSGWKTVLSVQDCVMEAYPDFGHAPSLSMTAPPPPSTTTSTAPPQTTTTVGPQVTTTTVQPTTTVPVTTTVQPTTTVPSTTTSTVIDNTTTTTYGVPTTTTIDGVLPRTGQNSLPLVWLGGVLAAAGCLITVVGKLRRRGVR